MNDRIRIVWLRHGEVDESFHETFGGTIDMGLSKTGERQAEIVSRYLESVSPIDTIYSSPMRRVRETLRPFLETETSPEPVITSNLREVDFGVWTGLKWEEVSDQHGASAFDWLKHLESESIPEAERIPDFRNRVEETLEEIRGLGVGKTHLVVCHGGVIRMGLSLLLNIPLVATERFEVDYASLSVVDIFPMKTDLQSLNYTPWRSVL